MGSFTQVLQQACHRAGDILINYLGRATVTHKGAKDLVTEADFAAQKAVEQIIHQSYPDHRFLGEEDLPTDRNGSPDSEYRWILDPLDGTTNYVHQVPFFCVSLALEYQHKLLVGGIYAPVLNEYYSAIAGRGAYLNGKPIQTSITTFLPETLAGVGFPVDAQQEAPGYKAFMNGARECQSLRRTGSSALNLAYVAAGRFDAAWSFGVKAWDVAAGVLLVKEAGGAIAAPDGSPFDIDHPIIVAAANASLLRSIVDKVTRV